MMKTSSPIDSNVALLPVETRSTLHTATSTDAAKFKETLEHRAIVSNVELGLLALESLHVLGGNAL